MTRRPGFSDIDHRDPVFPWAWQPIRSRRSTPDTRPPTPIDTQATAALRRRPVHQAAGLGGQRYPAYLEQARVLRGRASTRTPAVSCPTIQYKSGTRAYIESQGYDIVADFGDQFSDLERRLRGQDVQDAEPELLPPVGQSQRSTRSDTAAPPGAKSRSGGAAQREDPLSRCSSLTLVSAGEETAGRDARRRSTRIRSPARARPGRTRIAPHRAGPRRDRDPRGQDVHALGLARRRGSGLDRRSGARGHALREPLGARLDEQPLSLLKSEPVDYDSAAFFLTNPDTAAPRCPQRRGTSPAARRRRRPRADHRLQHLVRARSAASCGSPAARTSPTSSRSRAASATAAAASSWPVPADVRCASATRCRASSPRRRSGSSAARSSSVATEDVVAAGAASHRRDGRRLGARVAAPLLARDAGEGRR